MKVHVHYIQDCSGSGGDRVIRGRCVYVTADRVKRRVSRFQGILHHVPSSEFPVMNCKPDPFPHRDPKQPDYMAICQGFLLWIFCPWRTQFSLILVSYEYIIIHHLQEYWLMHNVITSHCLKWFLNFTMSLGKKRKKAQRKRESAISASAAARRAPAIGLSPRRLLARRSTRPPSLIDDRARLLRSSPQRWKLEWKPQRSTQKIRVRLASVYHPSDIKLPTLTSARSRSFLKVSQHFMRFKSGNAVPRGGRQRVINYNLQTWYFDVDYIGRKKPWAWGVCLMELARISLDIVPTRFN